MVCSITKEVKPSRFFKFIHMLFIHPYYLYTGFFTKHLPKGMEIKLMYMISVVDSLKIRVLSWSVGNSNDNSPFFLNVFLQSLHYYLWVNTMFQHFTHY